MLGSENGRLWEDQRERKLEPDSWIPALMESAKAALLWLSKGFCRTRKSVPVQEGADEKKTGWS